MSDVDLVRVATVGAAHGLRGEVRLRVHTDDPGSRLQAGTRFLTDPPGSGPLDLLTVREGPASGVLATFAGAEDRTGAEALRGVVLLAEPLEEDDAWYPEDLHGLRAELADGTVVGQVVDVRPMPAHDVLVVLEPDGARTLVPFVTAIVPTVDVAGGRVVLDPPAGLLARDQVEADGPADGSGS